MGDRDSKKKPKYDGHLETMAAENDGSSSVWVDTSDDNINIVARNTSQNTEESTKKQPAPLVSPTSIRVNRNSLRSSRKPNTSFRFSTNLNSSFNNVNLNNPNYRLSSNLRQSSTKQRISSFNMPVSSRFNARSTTKPVAPPRVTRRSYLSIGKSKSNESGNGNTKNGNIRNQKSDNTEADSFDSSGDFRVSAMLNIRDGNKSFVAKDSLSKSTNFGLSNFYKANEETTKDNQSVNYDNYYSSRNVSPLRKPKKGKRPVPNTSFRKAKSVFESNLRNPRISSRMKGNRNSFKPMGKVPRTAKRSLNMAKMYQSVPPAVPPSKPVKRYKYEQVIEKPPVIAPSTRESTGVPQIQQVPRPVTRVVSRQSHRSESPERPESLDVKRQESLNMRNRAKLGNTRYDLNESSFLYEEDRTGHDLDVLRRQNVYSADHSGTMKENWTNIIGQLQSQQDQRDKRLSQLYKSRQFRKQERMMRRQLSQNHRSTPSVSMKSIILGERNPDDHTDDGHSGEQGKKTAGMFGAVGESLDAGVNRVLDFIDWVPMDIKVVLLILGLSGVLAYVVFFFTQDNSPDVTGLEFKIPTNSTIDS